MNDVDGSWSDTTPMPSDTRLGVFGGTFDPPHIGHCIVAQELHFQLSLDQVVLVPAAAPPHKRSRRLTPAAIRFEMLCAAFAGDDRFRVSDIEAQRSGASYTVDTLQEIRSARPDARIFLGVGADQLAEFDSWRDPERISSLATVVGFARAGGASVAANRWASEMIEVPALEISSTDIRSRVERGAPVRFLLPDGVEDIIRRNGLYR